jgi:hypothetical protein
MLEIKLKLLFCGDVVINHPEFFIFKRIARYY